jgi:hypothetical protein
MPPKIEVRSSQKKSRRPPSPTVAAIPFIQVTRRAQSTVESNIKYAALLTSSILMR